MARINFQLNIPQEVHLRSLECTEARSQFPDAAPQWKFQAHEGEIYVSEAAAGAITSQLRTLGVRPGDPVELGKMEVGRGRDKRVQWIVSQIGAAVAIGEQRNGTFAVVTPPAPSALETKLAESIALVEARKEAARAAQATPATAPAAPQWAAHLAAQTRHLVDVYASVLAYAGERHGNAVKPDDVRAMMTTVYISLTKNGGAQSNAA